MGEPVATKPAKMSDKVVDLLKAGADTTSFDYEILPSGAGYDSAVLANMGFPSAMIIVRNDKGSHNPHEAMEMTDFFAAAQDLSRSF